MAEERTRVRPTDPPRSPPPSLENPPSEEWEEITLTDIARVLWRRRGVLLSVFLLAILGSALWTILTPPAYASSATLVPLSEPDIIYNWLKSRRAAEIVVQSVGPPLLRELYPNDYDSERGEWKEGVTPPLLSEIAEKLLDRVSVKKSSSLTTQDRLLTVTVELSQPALSRDVAAAYLQSLEALRPDLENATESQLFEKYFDGTNAEQARLRAETTAREKEYWLLLDTPTIPKDPTKPNVLLNMGLGTTLGIFLSLLSAFVVERVSKFRSELEGSKELAIATREKES